MIFDSSKALSKTKGNNSKCFLAASSGPTPPHFEWSSIWDAIILECIMKLSPILETIETDVSSQLVSIAKTLRLFDSICSILVLISYLTH